ncbi:MAG: phosphatase PAP2 family protein [Candidatus Marinimicrobia bacterium]|nr:phosphatase PAP2 family protein [Candidatus Neomarinimicrobiota bacterium]
MSNVSTVALTYALKFSVRRTRPNGRNDLSYPSGHTSVAFATASMFQMWYGWKAGVPAYAMAVMTAFQRMDDDQHWLSDVVMGAAVGIAIPYMIYKGEENAESGICPAVPPHFRQHSLQFPFGKIMKQKISRKTVSELMKWFRRHSREMPWRGSKDPYHIWVSEMMLQQTQVGTVRKYYSRWIERFPDIFSLADASLEEVLKVWEGLGYYTRARNFHKGAKYIAENTSSYGKDFPDNYEDWLKVPGVGPYTAAAVSSIAFAYPAGVLDANVLRVMSRLFCTDINTGSQAVKRELFEKISRSFYEYHPG